MFARRHADQQAYAAVNLQAIVALAQAHNIPLASHDDTTEENVADAVRDSIAVAEFPTTMEAARALHAAGIDILMGAPNVVRGGSHSGNIAAVDLARDGLLDILSSDYIPSSLLMGALQLPARIPGIDLAAAVRTVTKTPAEAVDLHDRGEIAPGKRADLIRVHLAREVPVVRSVWRGRTEGGMTEITSIAVEKTAAIGPGRLILVVGPSGAGKDTLLGIAKAACADCAEVVFARRVITRAASVAEDNEEVSAAVFHDNVARGDYAMHWEAHGHAMHCRARLKMKFAPGAR